MMTDEFLGMKLEDISDLFLEKLTESDEKCIKVDIPGCSENQQFILRVCLCKDGDAK